MPANVFQGATMASSIVANYYPNNIYFDHFVLQQVQTNSGSDNVYTLCVYAVLTDGPPTLILLSALPSNTKAIVGKVQFANMKLDYGDLGLLYPDGVDSKMDPVTIVPTGPYAGSPAYMAYKASTPYMHDLSGSVPINPSPPFNG